ncbi:MAG: metallophosphoesterase [Bacilli bacterium]|nr:metallophosphoesterase [Bacilli bacterium]
MKLNKVFLLAPVALLSLASCAIINQRYPIEDYFIEYTQAKNHKEIDDTGRFNILQLSDIHMSVMDNAKIHYQFMKKTIDEAKAIVGEDKLHLIVITGDVFTFANKDTVKELCNFFESQNTPWTLTFGNHDEQGYFSIDWLTGYLTSLSNKEDSNLLFKDMPNDDVFGSANFAINLPDNHRQIIMIDSNRYNYGQYYGYDSIHADQIDWYTRLANHARELAYLSESNKPTTSLAFFHIPVPEYLDAWNDASSNKNNSTFLKSRPYVYNNGWPTNPEPIQRNVHNDTSEGSPEINTGFFETARHIELDDDAGSYTKGMFVGHAHTNTNCMDYRPANSLEGDDNSIALCYGVKATDRVYCDEEMMGGQLIHYFDTPAVGSEAKKGSSWFTLDLIYHKYSDLKEGE